MSIFRMYWTRILKKPGAIFLWLLIPFVFMTIYTLVFGGGNGGMPSTGLGLIDNDESAASGFFTSALVQGPAARMITVHRAPDLAGLERLFEEETASAGLVIPAGFGQNIAEDHPVTITLYTNPRHFVGPQIASGVIGTLVSVGNGMTGLFRQPFSAGARYPNVSSLQNVDVKIVEDTEDASRNFNMGALFFPGLIAFVLMSLSLNLETRFLHDRIGRVNQRIVTAPIRPVSLLLQQRLYTVVFLYLIAVATAVVGGIIWRIPPVGMIKANLIAIALILFITGFNGSIFGLSNSVRATSAVGSILMMIVMVLGGAFFPVEFFPAIRGISKFVPTGIANVGLTQCLTGRELTISIPLLYAYCALFFVISLFLGRKRLA